MLIKNPSQDVLRRAIETIPITPPYGEVRLFAQGIQLPTRKGEDRLIYLDECENSGILPFSKLTLIGGAYPSVSIRGNNSLLSVLNGGKMHEVLCDDGDGQYSPETFDKFRSSFFPTLLENGYELQEIDLWVTSRSGYDWLSHRDITLAYKREEGGTDLSLNLEHTPTSGARDNLISWFEGLQKEVVV